MHVEQDGIYLNLLMEEMTSLPLPITYLRNHGLNREGNLQPTLMIKFGIRHFQTQPVSLYSS